MTRLRKHMPDHLAAAQQQKRAEAREHAQQHQARADAAAEIQRAENARQAEAEYCRVFGIRPEVPDPAPFAHLTSTELMEKVFAGEVERPRHRVLCSDGWLMP